MRNILQGFTMHMNGADFGIDTEEVTLPIPTPTTQDYRGGGMDMQVSMAMAAIESLEVTVKMAGHSVEIMKRMARGPGKTDRVTFRGAVLTEMDGVCLPHVCIIQGAINAGSRDSWQRGEKSGIEFVMNSIVYMRYEVNDQIIHELQHFPAKRIVDGVDQLADINRALGYA